MNGLASGEHSSGWPIRIEIAVGAIPPASQHLGYVVCNACKILNEHFGFDAQLPRMLCDRKRLADA